MAEMQTKKRSVGDDEKAHPQVLGADADHRRLTEAQADDPNTVELKTKVGKLVQEKFGGDYKRAFDHYDGDHDGGVNKDELTRMLHDADIGNGFTRGVWASKIIEKLDGNHDGRIQWTEFQSGIHH